MSPPPRDPFRAVCPVTSKRPKNEETRKAIREMAAVVRDALAARADGQSIEVGWTHKTYLKMVRAGHKIVGYPATDVFAHPNNIPGGITTLRRLTAKWVSGEISFADATADDVLAAEQNDVRRIFPGVWVPSTQMPTTSDFVSLPSSNISRPPSPPPLKPAQELVLQLTGLAHCFEVPVDGLPNADANTRVQRRDTKSARTRHLRGSRAGIKTAPFIVPSPRKKSGEPSAKHRCTDRGCTVLEPEISGREDESESWEEPWFASSQAVAAGVKRKVRG